jgi:hypothetical protein
MTRHHRRHATLAHADPVTPTNAAGACGENAHEELLVADEDIRLCAYNKWEAAGKPAGDGIQFWMEAEQELKHDK